MFLCVYRNSIWIFQRNNKKTSESHIKRLRFELTSFGDIGKYLTALTCTRLYS